MTTGMAGDAPALAGAALAAVSQLAGADLSVLNESQLLELIRTMETLRRTVEAFDNVTIPELEARGIPARHVVRSTGQFVAGLLNLAPFETGVRVRHARELGVRVQLTGERSEPQLPVLAAARASGAVSSRQADVVIRCLGTLRAGALPVEELAKAERFLVEQAELLDAGTLAGIARRLVDTLLPDGTLADERFQQRRRFLSCVPNGEGMHRLTADLDSETAALALTVLHSLAAPKPAAEGDPDERTAGQRMHDAFRSVLKIALRSAELPRTAGVPATVLITLTAEQFETRTGLAATSFGQHLSVDRALRLADQAGIAWVVHDSAGGVLNYGTTRRYASEKQSLALIARDQGCAFPGCTDPPEWTEKHHVIPWSEGGPTDLNNLVLLCDYHHDRIDTGGWQVTMRGGLPWFVPPAWVDPEQRPHRHTRYAVPAG
ncbi:HNH endonuclease signature motif containing protein [Jatrophihabitans sp.]|uniref:HNH endonuclease signature motif containing protein n=1 Tax=Jatrophihabitans sp. TaxID=1932789 RepID=UPI002C1433FF|nr:DUF222 domain-containing protein [Jatrophihabitans sp.]